MTDEERSAYYSGRDAAGTGQRCPFVAGTTLATEWTKGRDQKRRSDRMDLRPAFRKGARRPKVLN